MKPQNPDTVGFFFGMFIYILGYVSLKLNHGT